MCDVVIPVLIGVGALALLGGGLNGDCATGNCAPSAGMARGGYSVTIPQENGVVTHGNPTFAAAQPYAAAPVDNFNAIPAPAETYSPAPAPYAGVGGYANPAEVGFEANVGDVGVSTEVNPPRIY